MSLALRELREKNPSKKYNREQLLALRPDKKYEDGLTKQCHRDECDIEKIINRFNQTGTISHLQQFEGVYADFSDFDFHKQSTKLAEGETIFAALPAEIRKEFGQSPAAFFAYVNDPANKEAEDRNLKALAEPGQQLRKPAAPDADAEAKKIPDAKAPT